MTFWKHIKTSEYEWDFFGDKHGRETSKVRTFYEGNQYIWEANLLPNYVLNLIGIPMILFKFFLRANLLLKVKDLFTQVILDGSKQDSQPLKELVMLALDFI